MAWAGLPVYRHHYALIFPRGIVREFSNRKTPGFFILKI